MPNDLLALSGRIAGRRPSPVRGATDAGLVDAAIALARRHRLALWDATIVAAAQRAGCDELLTEDLGDGTTIEGVRIRDPFRNRTAKWQRRPAWARPDPDML
jgi:hypothetical protein